MESGWSYHAVYHLEWERALRLIPFVAIAIMFLTACEYIATPETRNPQYSPVSNPSTATKPSLTPSQANGLVFACLKAAASYSISTSAGWLSAEFNPANRQWIVSVWPSEEASKTYLGVTYLVDDATGEVLNCPPALQY